MYVAVIEALVWVSVSCFGRVGCFVGWVGVSGGVWGIIFGRWKNIGWVSAWVENILGGGGGGGGGGVGVGALFDNAQYKTND